MTRLVTAPCVGALAGALEGGIVFAYLSIIDVQQGAPAGFNNELIYAGIVLGIILGAIFGAVIGLIVALLNVGSVRGLLLGSLVGLLLCIYLFLTTGYHDNIKRMLAVIVVPGATSIGFIAAVLTVDRKEAPQSSAEPRRTTRIIS